MSWILEERLLLIVCMMTHNRVAVDRNPPSLVSSTKRHKNSKLHNISSVSTIVFVISDK